MNLRIRKLIIMHKALRPRDDIDRLYVLRKERVSSLAIIEERMDVSIRRLENSIKKCKKMTYYSGHK